jgi:RNA polymerase sigma-70 factor, ECF subfamily
VTSEDDEDLAQFRSGDHAVFERVVRRHDGLIRGLVRRYVPNDEDAKDVTQLAFARAFEHRESFRGDAPLRTWLCRIAVNLARNHSARHRDLTAGVVALEDVATFTSALDTAKLVAAELWQKAEKHLETLPPKQRLVVELRLFHDLPFKEIGTLADCSEASARVTFANGVGTLRSVLGRLDR